MNTDNTQPNPTEKTETTEQRRDRIWGAAAEKVKLMAARRIASRTTPPGANAPTITLANVAYMDRAGCIAWLCKHDTNGDYTDDAAIAQGLEPLDLTYARISVARELAEMAYTDDAIAQSAPDSIRVLAESLIRLTPINSKDAAALFIRLCTLYIGPGFHPDTDFHEYQQYAHVGDKSGTRLFTDTQASTLNNRMAKAFRLLPDPSAEACDLAARLLKLRCTTKPHFDGKGNA